MTNPTRFGRGEKKLKAMKEADYPGGVVVDPTPITAGEEVTVFYDGLLGKEGRGQVYLHYGFGPFNSWQNVSSVNMDKTGWGWVSNIEMPGREERFNFCFKDSSDNWDNNNGTNWSFAIHNGKRRH